MTEKLYYQNSELYEFTARVLDCRQEKAGWAVILDKTAFFPEGGGQLADTGMIGAVRVLDVQTCGDEILHYIDAPLELGAEYQCRLDAAQRFRRMQNHSGEHILSGTIHAMSGADNVGFHMGAEFMTIDFNVELSWDELMQAERTANAAVTADLPIKTGFPTEEELKTLYYRSKLELTENVRIVEIPGVDVCACCAPHLHSTGRIGLIKILEAVRHRGGTRISVVCGEDALEKVREMQKGVTEVSRLLSAKRNEVAAAVERVLAQEQRLKERVAELSMANARMQADMISAREGNICIFDSLLDDIALRELVNMLVEKCTGYAAVFTGSDEAGYRYIIGSRHVDLRAMSREINSAIGGKGGGRPEMIEGRASKTAAEIRNYVEKSTRLDKNSEIV